MKKPKDVRMAAIIADVGCSTRKRIRELPSDQQEKAWACVAAAIASAAIHDTRSKKVATFILSAITAISAAMSMEEAAKLNGQKGGD